ncbi:Hypothetical predicted protein [Podarcis lilfordi]|uniref:Uncharacterized protein n=1 Tax=Podarcis lilfordi TaxID=74358 RepID=A0AA35L2J8_9SAUR|nr:Hypothetical predicted protein [Podarcis lilfordi]
MPLSGRRAGLDGLGGSLSAGRPAPAPPGPAAQSGAPSSLRGPAHRAVITDLHVAGGGPPPEPRPAIGRRAPRSPMRAGGGGAGGGARKLLLLRGWRGGERGRLRTRRKTGLLPAWLPETGGLQCCDDFLAFVLPVCQAGGLLLLLPQAGTRSRLARRGLPGLEEGALSELRASGVSAAGGVPWEKAPAATAALRLKGPVELPHCCCCCRVALFTREDFEEAGRQNSRRSPHRLLLEGAPRWRTRTRDPLQRDAAMKHTS